MDKETKKLFNPDFLKSLARSEADIKAGRITKLNSLSDLRKKNISKLNLKNKG